MKIIRKKTIEIDLDTIEIAQMLNYYGEGKNIVSKYLNTYHNVNMDVDNILFRPYSNKIVITGHELSRKN